MVSPRPASSTWRLWLPLPPKFGRVDERILNGLDIGASTYVRIKMLHVLVAKIPTVVDVWYEKRHGAVDPTMRGVLGALVISLVVYVVLAVPIDMVWGRVSGRG